MTEGDLTAQMDQSDKVRELQDKIAHLRAQVLSVQFRLNYCIVMIYCTIKDLKTNLDFVKT